MMRLADPIRRLARVVWLAAMGFLLAAGAAAAHQGHETAGGDRAAIHRTTADIPPSDDAALQDPHASDRSLRDGHGGPAPVPCSQDDGGGHSSAGCCTIACHAALAAAAVTPVGSAELPFHRIVSLTDMLVGRSTDRAERPPKAG